MTESVFVIHYNHKHGDDISVYSTLTKAEHSASALITDRANEAWDAEDVAKLEAITDFDERLALFREVEKNVSYGENLYLFEADVE